MTICDGDGSFSFFRKYNLHLNDIIEYAQQIYEKYFPTESSSERYNINITYFDKEYKTLLYIKDRISEQTQTEEMFNVRGNIIVPLEEVEYYYINGTKVKA